jgi:hypothetical protein
MQASDRITSANTAEPIQLRLRKSRHQLGLAASGGLELYEKMRKLRV